MKMYKNDATRQSCFTLLTELLRVYPSCLSADYFGSLLPGVQDALTDKQANSNTKIDTLVFVGAALASHPAEMFQRYVPQLVPLITGAVDDTFYKVTVEALNVGQQLIRVLRPPDTPASSFDFTPHVAKLYWAVFTKLKATDIDQEVKERAITCTGYLLASFGDYFQAELPICLPFLLDNLRNERTRLTIVCALTVVAQSPLKIALDSVLPSVVNDLAEYLPKNQSTLPISTLQLLNTLYTNYQSSMTPEISRKVLAQLPSFIVESDLQIAQMTLALLTVILKQHPAVVADIIDQILTSIAGLIQSPLLEGFSLAALNDFLLQLMQSGLQKPTFDELKSILVEPIYEHQLAASTHMQYFHNAAKCLATLVTVKMDEAAGVISNFIENLGNAYVNHVHPFALLALGEIGRKAPETVADTHPPIGQVIMQGFRSQSEEVETAASLALGGVAVGNLERYLPTVLNKIETECNRQDLLLHALKEIISSESTMVEIENSAIFKPHIDQIWMVLLSHAGCHDVSVRDIVAECLGRLCLLEPERLLPTLKGHLIENDNPLVRATGITAVKFTIVDQPQPVDALLKTCIGEFLQTLLDPDLNVRHVVLVTLNSAAHKKPSLLKGDILASVLPRVYAETKVRRELIREVEMGPFKGTVDDGFVLRKAAFECMYTLLKTCSERLDIFEFLSHVEDGLKDHYDIKMLTYLILIRLATLCPTQTLQHLDRWADPLKQTCVQKVKANSMKQEYEIQDKLKRSALRAIYALQMIPDAKQEYKKQDELKRSALRAIYALQMIPDAKQEYKKQDELKRSAFRAIFALQMIRDAKQEYEQQDELKRSAFRAVYALLMIPDAKQEYEKQDELKRSALRAIFALQMIPEADKSPQLQELTSMIRKTPELALLYESVQKDLISGHQRFSYEGYGNVGGTQAMKVDE